ncbi:hypothetical protein QCA50_010808 [Cerrena zonata]|uniref:Uncharacterized protein n=1 Tax=Cerrena zonata TaxID=2478898 RepID=A0AAW0G3A0_9APHY
MPSSNISSSSLQVLAVREPLINSSSSSGLPFTPDKLRPRKKCSFQVASRPSPTTIAMASRLQLVTLYQDLFDCVIDELQDDPPTLKQCSLTAHCLLRQSRRHLFRRITLKPRDIRVEFIQLLISSPVSNYIKTCTIDGTHLTDYAKRRITIPTIQHLRDKLPSLVELTLRGCTIESDLLHDKPDVEFATSIVSLQTVKLDHVTLIDTHHLPTLLLCFPSRELHLSHISVINYSTTYNIPVEMSNRLPLGIQRLKCDGLKNAAVILGVLVSLLRADSVEYLALQTEESGLRSCSDLASVIASSVKQIEITVFLDSRTSHSGQCDALDLRACTSLSSLTLHIHLDTTNSPGYVWTKISSLLRHIPQSVTRLISNYIISEPSLPNAHTPLLETNGTHSDIPTKMNVHPTFTVVGGYETPT